MNCLFCGSQKVPLSGGAHERSEGPFHVCLLLIERSKEDLVKAELKARADLLQDDLGALLFVNMMSGVCRKNVRRQSTRKEMSDGDER